MGPRGYPPSLLSPMRCSYLFPPGRKSSASAILALVLPGDVSMALESRGALYCHGLLVGGGRGRVLNRSVQFFMWV
jgi:hypothetical protein